MIFRPATFQDLPAVCELFYEFAHETEITYNPIHVANMVSTYIGGSNHMLVLCELSDSLCGCFAAFLDINRFTGESIAQDRFVYVRPHFRNKKVAYGLYKQFLEWARARKCKEIFLSCLCSKDNDSLRRVMEWLGCTTKGYLLHKRL